jgi:phosphoribosylglycinamide formyltransferase-1
MPVPIAVLVSGTGSNCEAILAAASAGFCDVEVTAVLSDRPGAVGLQRAARRGVPTRTISPRGFGSREAHERALIEALAPHAPRLLVLAGYMRLLTPTLLGHFYSGNQLGVVNIHPADTRAYQGAHGYEFALGLTAGSAGRLAQTWITVHYVDEGMDTGPVIAQVRLPVHPQDTLEDLKARGLAVEHQLLPRVVHDVATGRVRLQKRRVVSDAKGMAGTQGGGV